MSPASASNTIYSCIWASTTAGIASIAIISLRALYGILLHLDFKQPSHVGFKGARGSHGDAIASSKAVVSTERRLCVYDHRTETLMTAYNKDMKSKRKC